MFFKRKEKRPAETERLDWRLLERGAIALYPTPAVLGTGGALGRENPPMFFKRKEKRPAETERLDWRLLERGAIALYHKPAVMAQDLAWFRQAGYHVHE